MASDAKNLRAAKKSISQNLPILVNLILIDPQSWAVEFKGKAMINSVSFDKASQDGHGNQSKAIAMLSNIEQLIGVGNWNIFKSLVTLIHKNDVDTGRLNSIAKQLIDVYKESGGGKEIDAALKDFDIPPVPPQPQPLNNDNLASPNPLLPEGNPNGGLRGQGVEDSLRRPINLEPLPRGEGNGSLPVAADPSPGHLRSRLVPQTHPVLDSEDKLAKERTKITKPDIPKKTSGWNWIKCAACWVLRAFFILVGIFIFAMLLEDYLLQLFKIKAVFSLLLELLKPNCNLVIPVIITTLLIILLCLLKYICSSSAESHRSEPTRKKEKMLYGDRIPNFAEKWKELELCTKALCRISDESGRAVGFGIKLDDSTGFLVTTIHSFCTNVLEMKDYASLLFPLRDGARDQQQLSCEMKKRIWQEFKYRFFVTEAKRGRDILCNQRGELNFFADVKNDVLVLRIADGHFPDGVKPMELNFDPKSTNISSWNYASVDIFAHPKCDHKDSEICNQACLLHSQGIISPTKTKGTKTLNYWISTNKGFSGSPVLAWTPTQSDGIEKLRLCPIAVHGGEYDHQDVQRNYCMYFLPIAEDIKKLLKEWKPEEERADSTFRDTLKLSGLVALDVNFED